MNEEELIDNIETILLKEDFNLTKGNTYSYNFIGEIQIYSGGGEFDPYKIDIDDIFEMNWETYDTLLHLYGKIKNNLTLKKLFINCLEETIRNNRIVLGKSKLDGKIPVWYDTTSLVFYFFLKIGLIDNALEQLEYSQEDSEKKTLKYLFIDINYFIKHEPKILSRNSLNRIEHLFNSYAEEKTKTNFNYLFTQIKYANLKEVIIGINQEISYDKEEVIEKINKFGFPKDLEYLLEDIEKAKKLSDINAVNSGMINGLRAFFHDLFLHIASKLSTTCNEEIPHIKNRTKIGDARAYIMDKLNLSDSEKIFRFDKKYWN